MMSRQQRQRKRAKAAVKESRAIEHYRVRSWPRIAALAAATATDPEEIFRMLVALRVKFRIKEVSRAL